MPAFRGSMMGPAGNKGRGFRNSQKSDDTTENNQDAISSATKAL